MQWETIASELNGMLRDKRLQKSWDTAQLAGIFVRWPAAGPAETF
jgi:hypothetical protein